MRNASIIMIISPIKKGKGTGSSDTVVIVLVPSFSSYSHFYVVALRV